MGRVSLLSIWLWNFLAWDGPQLLSTILRYRTPFLSARRMSVAKDFYWFLKLYIAHSICQPIIKTLHQFRPCQLLLKYKKKNLIVYLKIKISMFLFVRNNDQLSQRLSCNSYPLNIYLFRVKIETLEKGVKYGQS